ncbi:MAG: CoA transferase [Pseudomonadales bacterium]|nr:CoA transferase [Pseudomonadales bacterium]
MNQELADQQQTDQRQALTGLRIIDFTQVLAGPFATQQLAQLGADVIKVEQPGIGDVTRGLMSASSNGMAPSYLTCNLGKRAITLDLKHAQAKEVIHKLVQTADAVVENFKPGTIERLGFGYEALRQIKPDLIYASISGYGQSGPKSKLAAFDGAIQASSGMMSISGHPESGPVRAGYFAVDMSTALNAAFAITAALFRRHLTGEGQRIDVSMMDSAFMMQAAQITGYFTTGDLPDLTGNRSPTKQPTANVFESSDGYVQVIALKETQIQSLLQTVGHPEFYEGREDPTDRLRQTEEFNELLVPIFKSATTAHWLEKLAEAGVPASAIQNLAEAAEDEQNAHRLSITTIPDPTGSGDTRAISASHISAPAPPVVQRPPPRLGEHTNEVLTELGYDKSQIDSMAESGLI